MLLKKNRIFLKLNNKKNHKIFLFFLLVFSAYCAVTIGKSWDEGAHLKYGKITLDYLLSFGKIDKDSIFRENFSPIYC